MELRELIPAVAGLMSITGYETYDAAGLTPLVQGFDEDYIDRVGNRILVRRCGRANAPKILIDTHYDEIGMYVTEIKENGFLTVTSVGGLDARTLPSAEVKIYGKEVTDAIIHRLTTSLSIYNTDTENFTDLRIALGNIIEATLAEQGQ